MIRHYRIDRDAEGQPFRMVWLGDEAEQPESRARVLAVLEAAGAEGIEGHDLCEQARSHASIRRLWELSRWFGYVIEKTYVRRNVYRYRLTRKEPWARDPNLSVREARAAEKSRLEALDAESEPLRPLAQLPLFQESTQ